MESTNEIEKLLGKMPLSLLWNGNLLLISFLFILIISIFFVRIVSIPMETTVTILHTTGLKKILILSYNTTELGKITDSVLLCENDQKEHPAKVISIDHFHKHLMIIAQDKSLLNCKDGDTLVLKGKIKETVYRKLKH